MMTIMLYTQFVGPLVGHAPQELQDYPFMMLIIRILCALMLHLTLQPQVTIALDRIHYLSRHPENFHEFTMPFIICFMKFLVEIYQEVVCLAIVSITSDIKEVVMDYIALGVISTLDNVYYDSVRSPLKDQMQDKGELPITNFKDAKILSRKSDKKSKFTFFDKILILLYNLVILFYRIFYFHHFQWVIFYFVYLNVKYGTFVSNAEDPAASSEE